ncbi:MAG: hypothetical protein QOI71_2853 [Gaiellales bacterium]|nr:hypothetical protein [Gaiellales bacterium]
MTVPRPSSLGRFWLWASIGVLAMFGTFSSAGGIVWPVIGVGIGLLATRAVTRNRTILAVVVGLAGLGLAIAMGSAWPLGVGLVGSLAMPLLHARRDAVILAGALAISLAALLAVSSASNVVAVALAPALVILAALAAGRPQREAAGAITGAGLALFVVGAPAAGIPLTLAGAVLMLALGMRRRRLAVTSA